MYRLSRLVSITPIVRRTSTVLADVKVLGVVDVFVWTGLDAVDDLCMLLANMPFPPTIAN
jgi:hypothetical protein